MPTPLTYASLQAAVLAQLAIDQPPFATATGDPRFQQAFPMALNDAEGMIYKDIPFLATRQANTSLQTSALSRIVSLANLTPAISFPERFALLVSGSRVVFDKTQLEVVDTIYPSSTAGVTPNPLDYQPRYWAMLDDHTIVYAPTADAAYTVEIVGLFQQTPMSSSNQTTYIGNTYPEMLMAAVMFYLNGGLKQNFGAMTEDPRAAVSWKGVYDERMELAKIDEMRRRGLVSTAPIMPPPAKVQ